jgi:hypothetical protein
MKRKTARKKETESAAPTLASERLKLKGYLNSSVFQQQPCPSLFELEYQYNADSRWKPALAFGFETTDAIRNFLTNYFTNHEFDAETIGAVRVLPYGSSVARRILDACHKPKHVLSAWEMQQEALAAHRETERIESLAHEQDGEVSAFVVAEEDLPF